MRTIQHSVPHLDKGSVWKGGEGTAVGEIQGGGQNHQSKQISRIVLTRRGYSERETCMILLSMKMKICKEVQTDREKDDG